jgi:nucleotide-binding universal stress UspA family protein
MIKKILYATDLSPNSGYVFRYAINSAIRHDAKMVILHVIEMLPPTTRALLSSYLDEGQQEKMSADHLKAADELIKEKLHRIRREEFNDEDDMDERVEAIEICEGYPAEVILKKADAFDCDVIVMGNHGKGIISQTFLGSVSKRVLRRTRKPVFIIPLPGE